MTKAKGRTRKKKAQAEKPPPRLNQFGKPMARAVQTFVAAWYCSECGALSFGDPPNSGNPPVRCSNRKGCGKLFHGQVIEVEEEAT